jgi:hypothetical protein
MIGDCQAWTAVSMAGHFITPDPSTDILTGVVTGTSPITVGKTESIWVQDADGIYREFDGGEFAWEGGRVTGAVGSRVVYATDSEGIEYADQPRLVIAPAATNLVQQNDAFATIWSVVGTGSIAVTETGIDGAANSALLVTCPEDVTAGYAQYSNADAITSSGTVSAVVWVKQKPTATALARIQLRLMGGTATNQSVDIDCTDGTLSNATGSVTASYSDAEIIDGETWYKVTVGVNNALSNTTVVVRLAPGANDAKIFDCPMVYDQVSPEVARNLLPIFTGLAAGVRDADSYTIPTANFNDYQGSLYAEVWLNGDDNILNGFLSRDTGDLTLDDGTTQVTAAIDTGKWYDVGLVWDAEVSKMDLLLDGTWIGEVAYDGSMLSGDLDLFRSAANGGRMRNLRIYSDGREAPPATFIFQDLIESLTLDDAATFSRASTAYHEQPDGVHVKALTNEVRWHNARRVCNVCADPEDIKGIGWGSTATVDGSGNVTFTGGDVTALRYNGTGVSSWTAAIPWAGAIYIPPASQWSDPARTMTLNFWGLSPTTFTANGVNGGAGGWVGVRAWFDNTKTKPDFRMGCGAGADVVVTGGGFKFMLWNQPGMVDYTYYPMPEYQSVGDVAKYYGTELGNTIDVNGIITEATGAALTGPFKPLLEPSATNQLIYSNVAANWIIGGTDGTAVNDATGLLGSPTGAITFTDNNTTGRPYWYRATGIALAAETLVTHKFYLKKTSGDPNWCLIGRYDSATERDWRATFNTNTGELGNYAVPANYVADAVKDLGDWWAVCIDGIYPSGRQPGVDIYPAYNTTGLYAPADNTLTGPKILGNAEIYYNVGAAVASHLSPIFTTTAAVTRAADAIDYDDASIIADNETQILTTPLSTGVQVPVDVDDYVSGTDITADEPLTIDQITVYATGDRP